MDGVKASKVCKSSSEETQILWKRAQCRVFLTISLNGLPPSLSFSLSPSLPPCLPPSLSSSLSHPELWLKLVQDVCLGAQLTGSEANQTLPHVSASPSPTCLFLVSVPASLSLSLSILAIYHSSSLFLPPSLPPSLRPSLPPSPTR